MHDTSELLAKIEVLAMSLFWAWSPRYGLLLFFQWFRPISTGYISLEDASYFWSHASLSPSFRESGRFEGWTLILTPQACLPFVAFAARSASSAVEKSTKRYRWFQALGSPKAGVRGMMTLLTASLPKCQWNAEIANQKGDTHTQYPLKSSRTSALTVWWSGI